MKGIFIVFALVLSIYSSVLRSSNLYLKNKFKPLRNKRLVETPITTESDENDEDRLEDNGGNKTTENQMCATFSRILENSDSDSDDSSSY